MRALGRTRSHEEEEESVFVTMTDMTISFLLIVMLLLAFFATQLGSEETVPREQYEAVLEDLREARERIRELEAERDALVAQRDAATVEIVRLEVELAEVRAERDELRARLQQINPLEAYLAEAVEQRREILIELRERLLIEFPDLQVVISPEQDALRFQGEGLFQSGSSQLGQRQRAIVETMGRILNEILACYTLGERARRNDDCDSGTALIEAVQIEGHTDSDGSDESNLRLSTDRANTTLLVMLDEDRTLLAHENTRGQPVMSVSGYGEMRPIVRNETTEGRAANRRIDLRIIMYAPSDVGDVEAIGRRLADLRSAGGAE